jgi:hypothetical protein
MRSRLIDGRGRGGSARGALLLALVLAGAAALAQQDGDVAPPEPPSEPRTATGGGGGLSEMQRRYRLSAAIRPLLFWIGAKNVGGARIVWREDGGTQRGYELLLGSDPARAPRRINRWGWVREDAGPEGGTMVGVMNRSEDDSLDQAKAGMARDAKAGRFLFKVIRARVEDGGARAESTTVFAPQDYTFRQLGDLQQFVEAAKPQPRVKKGGLPPGTRPGLLFALADLVGAGVDAARAPGNAWPQPRKVQYTFDAGVYDLTVSSWERVEQARYGGRTYGKLVRLEFESRNLAKDTTERFVLACGTEGPLAGVPVFVRYQPKWWFKVEGVLDDEESL